MNGNTTHPRYKEHREALRAELLKALLDNPEAIVRTPGFAWIERSAVIVFSDYIDDRHDEGVELLRILAAVTKGDDVQLRVLALLERAAAAHADFHADDLVLEQTQGKLP